MKVQTILAVDDDRSAIELYKVLFENKYNVITAYSGSEAIEIVKKEGIDIVLLDILMQDMDGIDVLKEIKKINDEIEVIMVTAVKTVKSAIESMKLGAYDYITKPFDTDEILITVEKALEKRNLFKEIVRLKSEMIPFRFENIIGESPQMQKIYEIIQDLANNNSTVLITGESGTGKELIARAIHFNSQRKQSPFVVVDCATIPENLLESELFGYEKGAFTDAFERKIGKFELADTGTLFLDEIDALKLNLQGKILRAIETKEIQRIGDMRPIKIDVRIISATNVNLKKAVQEGKFREDLYYRLNVIPIEVPPLRERKDDIPLLLNYFIGLYNKEFGKKVKGISTEALDVLYKYDWPGNVRELKNLTERLVALSKKEIINQESLPLDILFSDRRNFAPDCEMSLKSAREEFERQFIINILEKVNWNQSKAARIMGIHRNTLFSKMHTFGIRPPKSG